VFEERQSIVGRDHELRSLDGFLGAVEDGPVALLLEGEAGIGKTSLWKACLAAAVDRSYGVVFCRPTESEVELAYAALGDLLGRELGEAMAGLPEPQRCALEVALLLREPEGREPSERAVALATLRVLVALSRERPLLVAVDDAQWLDPASERVLAFVARRLRRERIGVFVARRTEATIEGVPLDLARALPEGRFARLPIGSLELLELDLLLAARLEAHPSGQVLERLHTRSGGNPFFALEIARAMIDRGGPWETEDEIPIPASLHELLRERLERLPSPAREATEIAAALSRPTLALVGAARGDSVAAVETAIRAGILELDDGRLLFSHPLLASVAYTEIPSERRRSLHAHLAEILDEPEERGRHLMLAAEGPDLSVAAALDEAATRARARGAPGTAADLWEQARRLTPANAGSEARRRAVEAAERRFDAGEIDRARELLEEVVDEAAPGRERAQALTRLGWVCAHGAGFRAAENIFRAALAEHADDIGLRIEIEGGLAWCVHSTAGIAAAETYARSALELAESLGEPALLVGALSHFAFLEALKGEGIPLATIERAVAFGHSPEWSQIFDRPDWIHALLLEWAGELGSARTQFEALYRIAVDQGDEHALPFILFHFARIELLTGDWEQARHHARESRETSRQSGLEMHISYSLVVEALVDAHLGLVERARAKIDEGLQLADEFGSRPAGFELLAILGFLELSLGNARSADRALVRLEAAIEETGLREPALYRFQGDAIEAKVLLGQLDEVEAIVAELDRLAATLERPWVLVMACRGRALLNAARGDLDAANRELEQALVHHERLEEPFERARTLLILGTVHRRDRKKRAARDALEAAVAVFDPLGATLWSARARTELERIGGRAAAAHELTPTEQQVADLIASGLSYRETADALFISPKTVQWNLSKIYRKLGIRSRSELPVRLAAEQHPDRR
jgi:DNA-binding CsgD family transcriptional regulator/exonuclease VII small subunit